MKMRNRVRLKGFWNVENIALRIESISESREIYISEDIYKQVKSKVNYKFKDLGLKELKHIDEKIRIYKIN